MRRIFPILGFLFVALAACGGGEPTVQAEPLRGWDGEILEPGESLEVAPEALASDEPAREASTAVTTTRKPDVTTPPVESKKAQPTTETSQPAPEADAHEGPWSASADARLAALFPDEKHDWDEVKVACIADLINDGSEPTEDRVYELFAFYCDPAGYIETWSQTLTLPTAPGSETCFATVYVEEATNGESRDAAWFIQDRWEPPQPQRGKITDRLANECGLTEDDWFAAGMKRERSSSWKAFCAELDDVESTHSIIRYQDYETGALEDPAIYAQRLQAEIDDYSRLTPPADLAGDYQAFLTALQLLQEYIVRNQLGEREYLQTLSDEATMSDIGITPELEVAWARFQNVQYEDCAILRFD